MDFKSAIDYAAKKIYELPISKQTWKEDDTFEIFMETEKDDGMEELHLLCMYWKHDLGYLLKEMGNHYEKWKHIRELKGIYLYNPRAKIVARIDVINENQMEFNFTTGL